MTDQDILQHYFNEDGSFTVSKKAIHKKDVYYDYLVNRFEDTADCMEALYMIQHGLTEHPKCKVCGKPTIMRKYEKGFQVYCGKSCAAKDMDPSVSSFVHQYTHDEITKDVIKTLLDPDGSISSGKTSDRYLKNHGLYNALSTYYNDSQSMIETIWRILNDVHVRPVCKMCGKPVNFGYGFANYCSRTCASNDPEVKAKNAASVSSSMKKAYEERGDEIKAKRASSLKETHPDAKGSSPFSSIVIQNKAKISMYERYGVSNPFVLMENHVKSIESNRRRSIELRREQGYDIEYLQNGNILVHNGCVVHGDIEVDPKMFNHRTCKERRSSTILCPICNPMYNYETGIETIIKDFLNELGIEFKMHCHKILPPREVDFWIPSANLAIECNGLYWHSLDPEYNRLVHEWKYEKACENGITLLQLWEDDIIHNTDVVKGYIKAKLGLNEKIYARKCVIREVPTRECNEFVEANHLQGKINASHRYGLYYNNELVQVMTFGKMRKPLGQRSSSEGEFELYRLCSKIGYSVIGGSSKMLKKFIEDVHPKRIVSYCHCDISNGNVYSKLGFTRVGEKTHTYTYWKQDEDKRVNRFTLRKDKVDDGSGRTADQIVADQGYRKCYGSGTLKYVMTL